MPTLYDLIGLESPDEVKGYTQNPLEGATFTAALEDANAPDPKDTQFYVMLGTRGIWHKGWHALTTHPPAPSQWSKFTQDVWELYDLSKDRAEVHNVAAQNPELLEELKSLWFYEAGKYNGLPLEDRGRSNFSQRRARS